MRLTKKTSASFSVIIPVYNESHRVHNLHQVYSYLQSNKLEGEIIIVNDGSTDDTLALAKNISYKFPQIPTKIISYSPNKGKGHAIKLGLSKSNLI